MAVVAVLLNHIDKNAVININPSINLKTFSSVQSGHTLSYFTKHKNAVININPSINLKQFSSVQSGHTLSYFTKH